MGDINDIGLRFGLFNAMIAVGGFGGPPISGAINSATGGFKFVGVYGGSIIILSAALTIIVRHLLLRKIWGKI